MHGEKTCVPCGAVPVPVHGRGVRNIGRKESDESALKAHTRDVVQRMHAGAGTWARAGAAAGPLVPGWLSGWFRAEDAFKRSGVPL